MLIIGLGHKARQGKSTAALALLGACPLDTAVFMVAFADALRREVDTAIRQCGGNDRGVRNLIDGFKEIGKMPEWVRAETYPDKQRTLLQWWGTEYRRNQDPDYWPKRLFERLGKLDPDVAIITDVRFPNEVKAIHDAGGYVVKITRTTAPDIVVPAHASESALDGYEGWDYYLDAADVPELKTKATALYHEIVRRHET